MSLDAIHDSYLSDLFDYFIDQGYTDEEAIILVNQAIEEQHGSIT